VYTTFTNLWSSAVSWEYDPGVLSDRLTRGGPLARVPTSWSVSTFGNSDTRSIISTSWQLSYGGDASRGKSHEEYVGLVVRPSASVLLSIGPDLSTQLTTNQYLTSARDPLATATYGSRYVFGELHQTTLSASTRLDWTFTSKLSLQLFMQPFVSAGRYTAFKELLAARTERYGVYGSGYGTLSRDGTGAYTANPDSSGRASSISIGNPDFNVRSLRGDAVFRWEYRPGSTLFFVWQQQRSGFVPMGDFGFSRDVGAIFRQQPTNVFLVKATFWFAK
jgi:hypothetical protein